MSQQLSLAAFKALAEQSGEAVVISDADGRVMMLNRTAEMMVGWQTGELVGQPCRTYLRCLEGDVYGKNNASCERGGPATHGTLVHRVLGTANGDLLSVNARSVPLLDSDGKPCGSLCTFSTGRRDALLDRTAAQFLSNVSHELRAPMSGLANAIDLLSGGYGHMPREEMGRVLRGAQHRTLVMRGLVDNMLCASSIQLSCFPIQPRPADLASIVADAVSYVEPMLARRHQQIDQQLPKEMPAVMADAPRVVQALINLLTNAVKYGPPGQVITLSVSARRRHLLVSVVDLGPGVASEEQRQIFQRLYRSRRTGLEGSRGVGLGLAIVKWIINANGGRVGVESVPGSGATFWFSLPIVATGAKRPVGKVLDDESTDR